MGGAGVGDLGRARGDLEGAASFRFRFFRFFLVFFFSFVLLRPALGADRTPAGRVRGRRDVTGVARRGRRRRRGGQEVDASRARRDRGCGLRPGKRNNFFFFSFSFFCSLGAPPAPLDPPETRARRGVVGPGRGREEKEAPAGCRGRGRSDAALPRGGFGLFFFFFFFFFFFLGSSFFDLFCSSSCSLLARARCRGQGPR